MNKGGTINQTKNSANYASNYTKTYKASNSAFSYSSLKTQIDQSDVILLFGSYKNGTTTHRQYVATVYLSGN